MESGLSIQSVVNNGSLMTKKEILEYLASILHSMQEVRNAEDRMRKLSVSHSRFY